MLLTHMTATGREAGAALYGDRVVQAWLPYDMPVRGARVSRALHAARGLADGDGGLAEPRRARARKAGVPLFLVNARLSERSLRGYRRFASLTQPMFAALAGVAAQTAADAARLRDAGARDVAVTGNLKFDVAVPTTALRARTRTARDASAPQRPVWLAASTRDGEEALLLDALAHADLPPATRSPSSCPRHPQRFDAVAALLAERGLRFVRRSANTPVPADVARRARRLAGRAARATTPRRTSRSSAAACCRSAART